MIGSGCWDASESSGGRGTGEALAWIGDEIVTEADLLAEMRFRAGRARVDFSEGAARESVLQDLIDRRAQVARARALRIDRDPLVQHELDAVLLRHLHARELAGSIDGISVSDDEIAAYYAEHEDEFARPARVRIALVKLATTPLDSRETSERRRREADALLAEAARLPSGFHGFGPIAARVSDHPASRYKGGDVGWLVRGERRHALDPAVLDAAFALSSPGELAPVIEGRDGLYLVRILDMEPRSLLPLPQVAAQIGQRVLDDRRQRVRGDWLTTTRGRIEIKIDSQRLAEMPLPPEFAAAPATVRPKPPPLPDG